MPDSVISRCQIDKHGTGFLFRLEDVLDALREQSDLIHGELSALKTRLFQREQRVNKRFDAGVDKSLEDRTITLCSSTGFEGFGIAATSALFQI